MRWCYSSWHYKWIICFQLFVENVDVNYAYERSSLALCLCHRFGPATVCSSPLHTHEHSDNDENKLQNDNKTDGMDLGRISGQISIYYSG